MPDHITPAVAAQVLFHYGETGGYAAGEFVSHLIGTIARADRPNRALLGRGFPGYVEAADLIEYSTDGVQVLQSIAATRTGATS